MQKLLGHITSENTRLDVDKDVRWIVKEPFRKYNKRDTVHL